VREAWRLAELVGGGAPFAEPDDAQLLRAGVRLELVARLKTRKLDRDVDSELSLASRAGWTLVHPEQERYPSHVRALAVPPLVLTVAGRPEVLGRAAVAIVGSRGASAYGLERAAALAAPLAASGLLIVSGLARGIDAAAHRAAMEAGGLTLAVLGTGADVVYPAEHARLAGRIRERGALVTEFPPGTPPIRPNFPRRNRIIAGLSLAVVVVEAAGKSGSLVTARWAEEEGRALLAVPGRAGEQTSEGTLALLLDGAALALGAEDILDELPGEVRASLGTASGPATAGDPSTLEKVDGDARLVFDALPLHDERHLDELLADLDMPPERVLVGLFELELAGLAEQLPGVRFRRAHSRSGRSGAVSSPGSGV
jgi:DNA processing protein